MEQLKTGMITTSIKKIGEVHLNAKEQTLVNLLKDIEESEFETISQVKGLIHNELEHIKKMKEENKNDER